MSSSKKLVRQAFRDAVFARDEYRCRVCGLMTEKLDAHHITDRKLMPKGGYVVENGISLCEQCHIKAEAYHSRRFRCDLGYMPDALYALIGSSHELALKASERIKE